MLLLLSYFGAGVQSEARAVAVVQPTTTKNVRCWRQSGSTHLPPPLRPCPPRPPHQHQHQQQQQQQQPQQPQQQPPLNRPRPRSPPSRTIFKSSSSSTLSSHAARCFGRCSAWAGMATATGCLTTCRRQRSPASFLRWEPYRRSPCCFWSFSTRGTGLDECFTLGGS